MNILGLSFYYHDSAAALVQDGVIVAAGEEERFSRVKHDNRFPALAVQFVLDKAGITIHDVDWIVFYEKPFLKFERLLLTAFATFPRSHRVFRESMRRWITDKLWIKPLIRDRLGIDAKKVLFCDHHMSHAAASFFCSPFDESVVITVDGAGEWSTGTVGVGRGSKIDIAQEARFPHSLGLLYSAFTAYCGFEVNEGEYKLMGMAPYGTPRYVDKIHKMVRIGSDGSYWLDLDYFAFHYSPDTTMSPKFSELMGRPPRDPSLGDKSLDPFYCDVAASIQVVTEEIMIGLARAARKRTGIKNLCLSGGVALNSVANAKILRDAGFEQLYIPPAPGDDGGAIGAALWAYHHLLGKPRVAPLGHAYLGSEYGEAAIADFLREHDLDYTLIEDDERFYDRVVDDLVSGKVCGWVRGRFEWGPRALGARSIIADPRRAEMKDVVNAKIKFREAFRPFAPSVLAERCEEFFELPNAMQHYPARFMLYVVPVVEDKREVIPAITHVDGSGRLQTVCRETNLGYHRMIEKFGEATGVPVVLNTSFNLKGEPIVETPANAFNTFTRSEMDVLYLGNFVVERAAKKKIVEDHRFTLRHEGDSVLSMVS
ncbi:MAG: carbamoyltransferase [Deltaproteobacteria bacterium]|nr:carbamoyltransferase [Deltaproteobacteria bacterium]